MKRNIKILHKNSNFFNEQVKQHRVLSHLKYFKEHSISENEVYTQLKSLHFNEELINTVIQQLKC